MNRSKLMQSNISLLTDMLRETDQLDRRIFSDDQREEVITECVELNYDYTNHGLKDLLRQGIKGFEEFTDLELIEEIQSSYCPDLCADDEFDGFGVYPIIEFAVEETRQDVLREAVETNILDT